MEIVSSTPNDGEYYWTVPPGLDESNQYQIRITLVSNPSIYDYSDYFEIKSPPTGIQTGIPGYNLYILIGVLGVVSIILTKKRVKK